MNFKRLFTSLCVLSLFASVITSCDNGTNDPTNGDSSDPYKDLIQYTVTGDVKLNLEYENKNFFDDGVGEVTLKTCIDGDTAHFNVCNSQSNEYVKARFYGVDTPESTGQVEEYGQEASDFTKEKLKNAKENGTIVLSSPSLNYQQPEKDSTGERYLAVVWINETKKNSPKEELVCLNLWLVQVGLSYVKNLEKIPTYKETFLNAENQAREKKLNLFSGKPADKFNYGDYEDTSLLDIKKEIVACFEDSTRENKYNGKKVRVRGAVAGFANHMLYLQASFENEDTQEIEYAGINVFCGMASISSKYTKRNTFLEICALAQDTENFGFQLTSVSGGFPIKSSDQNDPKILYTATEIPEEFMVHEFNLGIQEMTKSNYDYLFSPIHIEENVTCTGGYVSDGDTCLYLKQEGGNSLHFSAFFTFSYKPYPTDQTISWSSIDRFEDNSFKLSGIYTFHKTASTGRISFQVTPMNSGDLVLQGD